jgi:hypothetical protein
MRPSCVKNGLVVGVIVLLAGVIFVPSLYANDQLENNQLENKLIEVTIEFWGLGKKHIVQLTQQEAYELDILFESIRNKLDNAETKDETIQIFNDSVIKLDSYGLLGDCSVKQVQKLVTGRYKTSRISRFIDRISDKIPVDNNSNIFCTVYGDAAHSVPVSPSEFVIFNLIKLLPLKNIFLNLLLACRMMLDIVVPFTFGGLLTMGYYDGNYTPANGYIETVGLKGRKEWDGNFYGQISWGYPRQESHELFGIIGFTGISFINWFSFDTIYHFYLGFAPYVNIGYQPPN